MVITQKGNNISLFHEETPSYEQTVENAKVLEEFLSQFYGNNTYIPVVLHHVFPPKFMVWVNSSFVDTISADSNTEFELLERPKPEDYWQ